MPEGFTPWNKGLTKDTNEVVRRIAEAKIGKPRPDMRGPHPYMKGKPSWNKGKTGIYSEQTKKRISEGVKKVWASLGFHDRMSVALRKKPPQSLEHRKKNSAWQQGIPLEKWEGFRSSDTLTLRNHFRKVISPKVLARDKYTCQRCGETGGRLEVHHILPWAKYPELRFDPDNCITLCVFCHRLKTLIRKVGVPTLR